MQKFTKEERLFGKKIIQLLFNNGHSFTVYPFKIIWLNTDTKTTSPARILISVSKKNIRKAIKRNKIKRRIRESYRKNKQNFYDFLTNQGIHCIVGLMYISKEDLSYFDINEKINIIIDRLISENNKTIRLNQNNLND